MQISAQVSTYFFQARIPLIIYSPPGLWLLVASTVLNLPVQLGRQNRAVAPYDVFLSNCDMPACNQSRNEVSERLDASDVLLRYSPPLEISLFGPTRIMVHSNEANFPGNSHASESFTYFGWLEEKSYHSNSSSQSHELSPRTARRVSVYRADYSLLSDSGQGKDYP